MLPPRPPSPPSGPPRGTNFSRRKLVEPLPPCPAFTNKRASSMSVGNQPSSFPLRHPYLVECIQYSTTHHPFLIGGVVAVVVVRVLRGYRGLVRGSSHVFWGLVQE